MSHAHLHIKIHFNKSLNLFSAYAIGNGKNHNSGWGKPSIAYPIGHKIGTIRVDMHTYTTNRTILWTNLLFK